MKKTSVQTDSLLALAGTLECDLADIEPAPVAELRVVPQDPELAKHATTPLLALAGTLECDLAEIEPAPVAEMREIPPDRKSDTHGTNHFLSLLGTLECDVTDIGKRHDEYIGDALIAELRGNDDE